MAGQIKVVPEALRAAAEQMRNIASSTEEIVDTGSSIAFALDNAWEGKGSEAAINELEDLRVGGTRIVEQVRASAEMLETVASLFEAVDRGEGTPVIAWKGAMLDGLINRRVGVNLLANTGGAVRIVPDQVRTVADRCRHLADGYESARASLRICLESLTGNWEGNAYSRFSEGCNEIQMAYSAIQIAATELAQAIVQAADRYEELDNSL